MSLSTSLSRLIEYYRRHGFRLTLRRLCLSARRSLVSGRSVLFCCELRNIQAPEPLPSFLTLACKKTVSDIDPQELQQITGFWNPPLAHRIIKERFGQDASLWLIRFHDKLAGYGWTVQGRTIEPHYFPLGPDDVQLLDFHVFPKYRGRAIDWFLMTHILASLAALGLTRAFGEAAEWNQASLASFQMASFQCLGIARKLTIFGRTVVLWAGNERIQNLQPEAGRGFTRAIKKGVLNGRNRHRSRTASAADGTS